MSGKKLVIDLLALKNKAVSDAQKPGLDTIFGLMCGTRQGGKSTILGTVDGDMLLITTNDEKHCITAAQAMALRSYQAVITPVVIDIDPETTNELSVDAAYFNLNNLLDSLMAMENVSQVFPWIALESINSIFNVVNNTSQICNLMETNKFRAQEIALNNLMSFIKKLVILNERGCNIIATMPCAADQDKTTGAYIHVEPIMQGYRNNMHVTGIFGDVLFVGPVTVEDAEGNSKEGRYLQFMGTGDKSGKKASTGKVQYANFRPRLNGLLDDETPEIFDADLAKLLKYKKKIIKKNKKAARNALKEATSTVETTEETK